ncbi:MAG: TatD family hydrolase [Armatimonadota bacterium]|nr:TatD family hydrolase [Armatimonadota bacterium]MDR5703398.1 TatD family hydrolase [Armatimonadota bacterium]
MFFDTHLHLDDEGLRSDLEGVLTRAREAGVAYLLTVGTDVESSQVAIAIASSFPCVYAAVGIHPHEAGSVGEEAMMEIRNLARHPKVVAIGETGLDYSRDNASRLQQEALFHQHIQLARELALPVVVHCREAHGNALQILDREDVQVIWHCFSGSPEFARECIRRGHFLSIAGPVTFRNARRLPEVARAIPLEHLLLETDSPYLAPEPYRGHRNEPAYLPLIASRVAELRRMPMDDLAQATTENALRMFHLRPSMEDER